MSVSAPVMCAAVCLLYVSVVMLLFCMCVPRGIHSLFAVAVLLLCAERLLVRGWYRCVSRCDVRDCRSLSSGMTASGTSGLSGCVV